ncbi:MAG: dioxygenase, partial [Elainellaceae cyanobacterium]
LGSFALATCSRRTLDATSPSPQASSAQTPPQALPTPACDVGESTPPLTAGPFYTPDSPERSSLLVSDTVGTRLILTGQVVSLSCTPIANALVDFWHTDDRGQYDNAGYRFRGHQFTDGEGRYWLETIVPGIYPGRTRHFHVRVQAPNQNILTTQLYFPEEPLNRGDWLFRPELMMAVSEGDGGKQAKFDFVLEGV